jgi:hypothetical protein
MTSEMTEGHRILRTMLLELSKVFIQSGLLFFKMLLYESFLIMVEILKYILFVLGIVSLL